MPFSLSGAVYIFDGANLVKAAKKKVSEGQLDLFSGSHEWHEEQHPRGNDGKFAAKKGSVKPPGIPSTPEQFAFDFWKRMYLEEVQTDWQGKERSAQQKESAKKELANKARSLYLRHGSEFPKALLRDHFKSKGYLSDYDEDDNVVMAGDALILSAIDRLDVSNLSDQIMKSLDISADRAKARSKPVFKPEELDIEAALTRDYRSDYDNQDIEYWSIDAHNEKWGDDWPRQMVFEQETDGITNRSIKSFIRESLDQVDLEFLKDLFLGSTNRTRLLNAEELREEGLID